MAKVTDDMMLHGSLPAISWPGCYPIFYLDGNDSVLCAECATEAYNDPDELDLFKPIYYDINWEDDSLYCDNCSCRIESAYNED